MLTIKYSDVEEAFDFVSSGTPYTHNAYISRSTGEIFWESELMDEEEQLPEDLGDPDRYVYVPHKNELDLGRRLVMRFVAQELPDDYGEVADMFSRAGAYSRYKALLGRRGKLEAWYKYEGEETRAALMEWGEEEGIELT